MSHLKKNNWENSTNNLLLIGLKWLIKKEESKKKKFKNLIVLIQRKGKREKYFPKQMGIVNKTKPNVLNVDK